MSDIKKTDLYWIIKPIWDSKGYVQGYEEFRSIPSADFAQVRHGRWIQRKIRESQFVQNGYTRLCCSVCNEYSEGEYHYCPNCGARMDGDEDDD